MKFDATITLEHLNPELVDLECEIEVDEFRNLISVTILEDLTFREHGILHYIYKGDLIWDIDNKTMFQIEDRLDKHYAKN